MVIVGRGGGWEVVSLVKDEGGDGEERFEDDELQPEELALVQDSVG